MAKKKVTKKPVKLFLLAVTGGTEIEVCGPYRSEATRLKYAKEIWATMSPADGDNLFKLNVKNNNPSVVSFLDGELDEDEDADEDEDTSLELDKDDVAEAVERFRKSGSKIKPY